MDFLKVSLYTFFMYIFLIIIIRIMGKREVGSLSIFDLAVYFTISDLVTIAIVDHTIPFYFSVVSVVVLCILQVIIAKISLKSKKARDILDGSHAIIINDGNVDFEEMKKQRYSLDDLFTQIREKGYDSLNQIKWAVLENSGKLSVITYKDSKSSYPDPIIKNGVIDNKNLNAINKTEQWLYESIQKANIKNIKDIEICLYLNNTLTFTFKNTK